MRLKFAMSVFVFLFSAIQVTCSAYEVIWLEAEQFDSTGKWSNDPEHMDIMGSPYLLTNFRNPVEDAVTTAEVKNKGMRPCAETGQALGTAAAIATNHKESPRCVYNKHIKLLQYTLVKDGCRLMCNDGGMREPEELYY